MKPQPGRIKDCNTYTTCQPYASPDSATARHRRAGTDCGKCVRSAPFVLSLRPSQRRRRPEREHNRTRAPAEAAGMGQKLAHPSPRAHPLPRSPSQRRPHAPAAASCSSASFFSISAISLARSACCRIL